MAEPFSKSSFYDALSSMASIDHMRVAVVDELTAHPEQSAFLKAVGFFLAAGRIPSSGIETWELPSLRAFADQLVKRGMLKRTVLGQFD